MSPTLDAFLRSWPVDAWLSTALLLAGGIYLRGWLVLHRRDARGWHGGRPVAFLGGLAATYLALASPIEPFASLLLQVHMVQHLLLMMVAPPLVWLAWPLFPLLRGLPHGVRKYWAAPLLRWHALRQCFAWLTHPLVALPLYVSATWLWHLPRAYELALRRGDWHGAEHVCFITSALLFWYPVVRPYPSRPRWSRWILIPYLILADVQNTLLAAWLTFAPDVLYPHYSQVPRLAGISALDDQAMAGVLMWVPGSIAFLLPLFCIGLGLLSDSRNQPRSGSADTARRPSRPANTPSPLPIINLARPQSSTPHQAAFNLLDVSLVGRFLRWRRSRLVLQGLVALLASLVIYDGLRGPGASPMNLAGVLPWTHWRGVVVFGLLMAGNVFCMACPFTLPRSLARRWLPGGMNWPRWLRSKWLAVALMATFLWSYETFALWDSPWLTAWIAVGYFVAAFVVDSVFRGAAFCKYVCPIGQFNFVQSLVSPLEVKVREAAVCTSCHTQECIRGTRTIPGCEMNLFQPRKSGNLDCTFCLDCVHACPHDNIGVLAVIPGKTLWSDPFRSGIGRLSRRPDVAALVLVLVFGALANAGGMIAPVVAWQDRLGVVLGHSSRFLMSSIYFCVALTVLPIVAAGGAAVVSRAWGKLRPSVLGVATRFSYALIPIGFSMWLAHYSFHFLTSCDTIFPATQRFLADLGCQTLGQPSWQLACCRQVGDWLPHLEILMLDFGLLLSLYTGFRIAEEQTTRTAQALKAFAPWGVLIVLVFIVGVWIVSQPMQMRGTLAIAG
jgi:cytochrome c oxidase assembly factor CtaG/ferredoxin